MTKTPAHKITNADSETMTGDCSVCGPAIPILYRKNRYTKVDGTVSVYTIAACKYRHRESMYNAPATKNRRSRHTGLTPTERLEFLRGKVCAVCGTDKNLRVDHCHSTGRIRGALCNDHNRGLGLFGDDAAYLRAAADYLDATRSE